MRALLIWGWVSTTLLAACRAAASPGAATSASPSAKPPSSASAGAGPSASPTPAGSAAPDRTAKIEALIERWRSAQNAGDFAEYEKLYAKQFVGIKRVGVQTF